ncbi:MAG: PAS domain S-box protein, partial [Alphaproteobacteria bacterium]
SALHKAIDNGKVVASNPFDFIEGGRGYFIFKAIYRGHEIPTTMQERRKHVSAVIAFHLKADTFFSDILTQMPTYSVDVRNAATPPALNDNLIFSLSKTARQTSLDQLLPVVNLEYPLTGHASNFTARMSAFPDFISHLTWLSVILLITSVIGNASFICVLNNRRAALERAREDEALLRRSESRFRDFADSSSDWYWEMDRDLKFSRFSENLNDIVGVPPESLLGKTRGETGIPGIDPAVWKKHLEDLAAHRSFREFKHPRTLDNGEVLYLSINGKAIFDETGRLEGYRGTGSDITDRQKNELALQRANEDLEQRVAERTAELQESAAFKTEILDSALDCVISIDQEARVIEWNESAHHTFGYARNEAVGRMLVDLIVPPAMKDAHNAGFKRYIQTNEAKLIGQRIEITAMRANGDEFPIEMAISAQDRKDGKIITAYLRDLSEAKNAEERLQQAQKMEAVGQLTGGVAHDFNNLLGVILGNAEILSDTVGEDHPMPRAIIRAANRGAELTQRLLAFSRQQPLRPSSIN